VVSMIRYAGPSDWLTCCKSHETGRARVEKKAECKVQATDPEDPLGASRPQSYFDLPSSEAGRELQEKHVCENHQAALPQQHLGKALAKPCCMCMAHGRGGFFQHMMSRRGRTTCSGSKAGMPSNHIRLPARDAGCAVAQCGIGSHKMKRRMEKEGTVEGGTGFDWEGVAHQNCTLCTFATIKRMLTPGETTFGSPVLHTR
jgi:hypothetical protein